jgi:hypothetical protein
VHTYDCAHARKHIQTHTEHAQHAHTIHTGMLKHEQQGLAGSKGDGADDSGPLPPLSQVSNEGLPGRRKSRGRHDEGKQASGGEGATARGNAGAEKDLLLSHLGGEGGGNGRLVTSALNMLEELERACYASSNRASCASLRSSMSRAMRSVADHLGMRQSRHKILGAGVHIWGRGSACGVVCKCYV